MTYRAPAVLTLVMAVLAAQVGSAAACSCPKEYMLKKYGTVAMNHRPALPLPPPLPPSKSSAPATTSGG